MRQYFLIITAAILITAGCAPKYQEQPMPILTPPVYEEQDPAANPGSLYDTNRSEFLYDDNRASRVGDIVLVKVSETTNTKLKSETTAKKENTVDTEVTAMPGASVIGNIPLRENSAARPVSVSVQRSRPISRETAKPSRNPHLRPRSPHVSCGVCPVICFRWKAHAVSVSITKPSSSWCAALFVSVTFPLTTRFLRPIWPRRRSKFMVRACLPISSVPVGCREFWITSSPSRACNIITRLRSQT